MTSRIPLANSTVSATYPRHEPVPPSSELSRVVFNHFVELTERLREQEYFWTSEWQKDEREADEDIKAGRVRRFFTAKEAIIFFRSSET